MKIIFLAPLALVAAELAVAAPGGTAHLYAYRVKNQPAFESGYRRHLKWHAARADSLPWFAWYVETGERLGAFVDGTFGTTPEALAGRPDPSGDGADFEVNVAPFVEPLGDEGWELWPRVSSSSTLERRRPGERIQVALLEATDVSAFERSVLARTKMSRTAWYRASKQPSGRYLVVASAGNPNLLRAALTRLGARILSLETWRYAPRLALMPGRQLPN